MNIYWRFQEGTTFFNCSFKEICAGLHEVCVNFGGRSPGKCPVQYNSFAAASVVGVKTFRWALNLVERLVSPYLVLLKGWPLCEHRPGSSVQMVHWTVIRRYYKWNTGVNLLFAPKIPFQVRNTVTLGVTVGPGAQGSATKWRSTRWVRWALKYSDSMGHKNYMYFTEKRVSEEQHLLWSAEKRKRGGENYSYRKKKWHLGHLELVF